MPVIELIPTVAENRKRGAKRAAASRRAQHQQLIEKGSSEGHNDGDNLLSDDDDDNEEYCGVCGTLYEEETDEIEKWIACDDCGTWYHWECTNTIMVEPEFYIIIMC